MAKINWSQVGQDFQQKYQGTWCRYVSPITKQKDVFYISSVEPAANKAPDVILTNPRQGELHLSYATEAELDFSYPDFRNFQHKKRALRMVRLHERQYKKGICEQTAKCIFPYAPIVATFYPEINYETLNSAFQPLTSLTFEQAVYALEHEGNVSVCLSPDLSLGHGNKAGEYWLWFHTEPIALVQGNRVEMKVQTFKQEVLDFLRLTGDYARAVV